MQTIGERLEEARKRKGVSIREAAEITKIRGDYLQKFEANTLDIDLPPLYLRGFIRTYAKYLDLDVDRMMGDLDSALARDGKPQRREHREPLGRVDFNNDNRPQESAEPANPGGRSARDQALLIKFGLLGSGALVAIVVIILLIKVIFSSPAAKTANNPLPEPAAVQADGSQTLVFTATDPTRIKVVQTFDGTVLFNGSLSRGESKSLKKQGLLTITVEDRTKVRMEVNGKLMAIPTFPANQGNYGQFKLD